MPHHMGHIFNLMKHLLIVTLIFSLACNVNEEETDKINTESDMNLISMGDASPLMDDMMDPEGMIVTDMLMPPRNLCDELGLPRAALQMEGSGFKFGDIAAPFSMETLKGLWRLEDAWTGCDSYVFLTYFPNPRGSDDSSETWMGDLLWETALQDLVITGPQNVHYFFTSYEGDAGELTARMETQRARFEETLTATLEDDAERDFWRARVHFVTERVVETEGGVKDFFNDYMMYLFSPSSVVDLEGRGQASPPLPWAFGIDREQRWDSVGSLSPIVGQDSELGMVAFAPHFYNHKATLSDRTAREEATVVNMIDESVTARHHIRTLTLPDAATMATFNKLEIDVNVTCPHRNVFGCSEWDRNARVLFCLDSECEAQREIARWITPYWRRGHRRWLIDASPFIPLMVAGGSQTFKIVMGPEWERATERHAKFDLRFGVQDGPRPAGVERVYTGGDFNSAYNMSHPPVGFSVPLDASRVELVAIVSGHGQSDRTNCSEWCDHRHAFEVNGREAMEIRSNISIGTLRGCADHAGTGVPSGQWGNWAPGRAYWCPGWPVDAVRMNITDDLFGTDMNQLSYSANLAGGQPDGGKIDLSVYIVWYDELSRE